MLDTLDKALMQPSSKLEADRKTRLQKYCVRQRKLLEHCVRQTRLPICPERQSRLLRYCVRQRRLQKTLRETQEIITKISKFPARQRTL